MKGERGEAWVVLQGILFVVYIFVPQSPPAWLFAPILKSLGWTFMLAAVVLFMRSLLDLGSALTPFPRPLQNGKLVTTGAYGLVRHPIYCAVIFSALGFALVTENWVRIGMSFVLFAFFDLKARKEERWLTEKYLEYDGYRRRVKKLIPSIY